MQFNVKALAVTSGILWGLSIFALTWWIILFDGPGESIVIARIYRGYSITPLGSLIGLIWGLGDGFIGGAIFGWAYNLVARKMSPQPQ